MYVSIGPEKIINSEDIIGIFDIDTATATKATKELLKAAEKNKMTEMTGGDIPKSFVMTKDGKIYFEGYEWTPFLTTIKSGNKYIYQVIYDEQTKSFTLTLVEKSKNS